MSENLKQHSAKNERPRDDYEAIKQAILDYVEGVYETDPLLIERSVHPELAKRGFFLISASAEESTMSFSQFIEHTKTYNKDGKFPSDAPKEIIIEEYMLVSARSLKIEPYRKEQNKWVYYAFGPNEDIELACLNVHFSIAEAYDGINPEEDFSTREENDVLS
ncbi:MAG: nuclear transport factor 2 family protein [Ktedonobacteraceae bacterium]